MMVEADQYDLKDRIESLRQEIQLLFGNLADDPKTTKITITEFPLKWQNHIPSLAESYSNLRDWELPSITLNTSPLDKNIRFSIRFDFGLYSFLYITYKTDGTATVESRIQEATGLIVEKEDELDTPVAQALRLQQLLEVLRFFSDTKEHLKGTIQE